MEWETGDPPRAIQIMILSNLENKSSKLFHDFCAHSEIIDGKRKITIFFSILPISYLLIKIQTSNLFRLHAFVGTFF